MATNLQSFEVRGNRYHGVLARESKEAVPC